MKARNVFKLTGLALLLATPVLAAENFHYDHAKVIDTRPVYEVVEVSTQWASAEQ